MSYPGTGCLSLEKQKLAKGTLLTVLTCFALSTCSAETKEVPKERLIEILREVDLEYLVERKGALTAETPWEDVLSLSEKQRLAMVKMQISQTVWLCFPQWWLIIQCVPVSCVVLCGMAGPVDLPPAAIRHPWFGLSTTSTLSQKCTFPTRSV